MSDKLPKVSELLYYCSAYFVSFLRSMKCHNQIKIYTIKKNIAANFPPPLGSVDSALREKNSTDNPTIVIR